MQYRKLAFILAAAALTGCATQPTAPSHSQANPPSTQNNTPSADWENLGVSPNGNILNEIDKLSIHQQGKLVAFRDRKTIFDMTKENFLKTPHHKVSINSWLIDCQNKTYQLKSMTLLDENGREIASFTYNDKQIRPMAIVPNSASDQQMLFVCKNH